MANRACASPRLLGEILRGPWGFPGYVVSDCGAVGDIYQGPQGGLHSGGGGRARLKAGTDLDCGSEYSALVPAVRQKFITEAESIRPYAGCSPRGSGWACSTPRRGSLCQIPYSVNDSQEHARAGA